MTFLLSFLSISVSVWTLVLVSRSTSALEHVIKFCVTTEKLLPQLSLESKCTSYYTLKWSAFVYAFLLTFSILTWLWRAEFRSKTRANQLFLFLFDIFCWSFKCFVCSCYYRDLGIYNTRCKQAVCVTTHKGSWVKLLLCLISIVTRSSSHLVREINQTQGSKHCYLFLKTLRNREISRIFKIS